MRKFRNRKISPKLATKISHMIFPNNHCPEGVLLTATGVNVIVNTKSNITTCSASINVVSLRCLNLMIKKMMNKVSVNENGNSRQ